MANPNKTFRPTPKNPLAGDFRHPAPPKNKFIKPQKRLPSHQRPQHRNHPKQPGGQMSALGSRRNLFRIQRKRIILTPAEAAKIRATPANYRKPAQTESLPRQIVEAAIAAGGAIVQIFSPPRPEKHRRTTTINVTNVPTIVEKQPGQNNEAEFNANDSVGKTDPAVAFGVALIAWNMLFPTLTLL